MITVKTYVSIDRKWYDDFIPKKDYSKYFIEYDKNNLDDLKVFTREGRTYGFVDIEYTSQNILGSEEFGSINDIWLVYFQLVEQFLKNGKGSECFPDYECYLTLEANKNNGITLTIGNERKDYDIDPYYFCKEIIKGAKTYFETYAIVKENNDYGEFIKENINPLLNKL
ncbi:hypothetical protein [Gottfriedia luciferensis]|uniref:hypothetical protein n=1 Tax=Gottfriedia luciferensis TaxID=178774 RepID=UPI000B43130B|nr:hypothetical protein [Gottfriedia luciferensis]